MKITKDKDGRYKTALVIEVSTLVQSNPNTVLADALAKELVRDFGADYKKAYDLILKNMELNYGKVNDGIY